MKKILLPTLFVAIPVAMMAQSTVDAYTLSQSELRGTARFMSMGGAFTALGGDLSTLNQNPAGVGVYRGSDIGVTLDINFRSYDTQTSQGSYKENQTKAFCNNFGYVGTTYIGSGLRSISWGASYGRVASFDRITNGYNMPTNGSLTNYIAAFTNAQDPAPTPGDLSFGDGYNPYLDSGNDWLSILAYTSGMINDRPGANNQYMGLYQNGTVGDALYNVRERGYVDEYNFDIGGNVSDVVYWGIGFGVTDISYSRDAYYSESMENARIYGGSAQPLVTGDAGFELYNTKRITGNGWNFKLGVIVRPLQELRLGFAFHTPTWYNLSHAYNAEVDYSYYNPSLSEGEDNPLKGNEYTGSDNNPWASFDSKLNTPWRLMFGAALVIGNQAIVSVDYERQAFNSMKVKNPSGYGYEDYYGYYYDSWIDNRTVNDNISNVFKGSNIIRVGLEYRVTPQFSLRAGYNAMTCNVKQEALDGRTEVLTSGTDPSFSLENKLNQAISLGLGYKYKGWYFDAAYVHRNRQSEFKAYTDYDGVYAPGATVKDKYDSMVLSVGYKF